MGNIVKDITGKKFGRLTVLRYDHLHTISPNKRRGSVWECRCDCGKTLLVHRTALMSGNTRSCGCYNKEVVSLPYGTASLSKLFYVYKRNATQRGLTFDLTKERFTELIHLNCYYCGRPPSRCFTHVNCNGGVTYNGIDRIDNSKGYIEGNCVPCCSICNYAKRELSYEDFKSWIYDLSDHILSRDILSSGIRIGA